MALINNSSLDEDAEDFHNKVNDFCVKISLLLKSTDTEFLDNIENYVEPRKNICKIIEFYDLIISSNKYIDYLNDHLIKNEVESKSEDANLEIKDLEQFNFIDLVHGLNNKISLLNEFRNVKISDQTIQKLQKYKMKLLNIICKVIMEGLERLPKIIDKIDKYSKFLIKQDNSDEYLRKYNKVVLYRMGFSDMPINFMVIIKRTKDLSKHFRLVDDFNRALLGSKEAKSITNGMIKFMILDLNKTFVKVLDKIRIENKPDQISFLIKLYSRLRHDTDFVPEIEELFVFKKEILTLIFNCFVQFFTDLNSMKLNEKCETQEICKILYGILNLFEENKDIKRAWVDGFGSSFGIHNKDDLNQNLVDKVVSRVLELGRHLDPEKKSVYYLNNIALFKNHVKKTNGDEMSHVIYKNTETIIGLWRIKLETFKGPSLDSQVAKELENRTLSLFVEDERIIIVDKLKSIIAESLQCNNFDYEDMKLPIENVYSPSN